MLHVCAYHPSQLPHTHAQGTKIVCLSANKRGRRVAACSGQVSAREEREDPKAVKCHPETKRRQLGGCSWKGSYVSAKD